MSDSNFDPYHKWLSIPRAEQPANYYRLLGVPLFESDSDVIESAAQRQITHVRSFALGQHAELSQSILNELAKARATLLDPAAKVKYDAWLNAQQRQPAVAPSPPNAFDELMQSVPFDIPTAPVAPRKASRPKSRRQQSSKLVPMVAGFIGLLLVGSLLAWLLSGPKQPVVAEFPVSMQPSRDIQVVEDQDEVQPLQTQSRLGAIIDSAKPSSGGTAEAMNEEAGDATELGGQSETTLPPEPEEERTETVVVSSEQSDANNTPPAAVAPFDSDQAKSYQEAWAEHLGVDAEVTNSIGMKLRVIPPGTFMMGTSEEHPSAPLHQVTLTKPFMIGVHEVTQADYQTVMGTNPSRFKGLRNPVEGINWNDATEFCRRLSLLPREKRAGRVYRLPSEAEWEFACRAGTTTTYSFGDDELLLSRYGWTNDNGGGTTHPVGSKLANPFGLHDVHGNVWEWCQDWYGGYPSVAVTDPKVAVSGSSRVARGGSWYGTAELCRSANRFRFDPSHRDYDYDFGFRVTCVPSGQSSVEVAASPPMDSGEQDEPEFAVSPPIPASVNDGPEPAIAPFDEAKAREYQEAWAKHLNVPVEVTNAIGMKFMVIPPGTFQMGSDESTNSSPAHQVTISQPFMLGKYEVTHKQFFQVFKDVVNKNIRRYVEKADPGSNLPITVEPRLDFLFCRRLSMLEEELNTGYEYRLPTEAEWEYACRAGTVSDYSFGPDLSLLKDYSWHVDNMNGKSLYELRPVGQKKPNPWGLHDMHGNAGEFCADFGGEYNAAPSTDPFRKQGALKHRVSRSLGMHFHGERIKLCASWVRNVGHGNITGFRVVRSRKRNQLKSMTNSIGMQFLLVPAGEFVQGHQVDEKKHFGKRSYVKEHTPHRVLLTDDYYLGVYEVTQKQFEQVLGFNPSEKRGFGPRLPVHNVSWLDANAFCVQLTKMEARQVPRIRYRLPTESEWEFACRAGTTTPYFWQQHPADRYSDRHYWYMPLGDGFISEIGSQMPNPWGFSGMYGNVSEYCLDRFQQGFFNYSTNRQINPLGRSAGNYCVVRGGAQGLPSYTRSSYHRDFAPHNAPHRVFGFRVVAEVVEGRKIKKR